MAVAADYVIIRKIKAHKLKILARERLELAQKLRNKRRRDKVIRRIIAAGLGLTASSYVLMCRGGIDQNGKVLSFDSYANVDHLYDPQFQLPNGITYLNHEPLRTAIYEKFKRKARDGVIYVTATALCQIARKVGTADLMNNILKKFPVTIILHAMGITDGYQLIRKGLVTGLTASSLILFYYMLERLHESLK